MGQEYPHMGELDRRQVRNEGPQGSSEM